MNRPLHETLRAFGQGMLAGTALAVPLGFAVAYLNAVQLVVAALATGVTLITAANALKRRDQRKTKDWK